MGRGKWPETTTVKLVPYPQCHGGCESASDLTLVWQGSSQCARGGQRVGQNAFATHRSSRTPQQCPPGLPSSVLHFSLNTALQQSSCSLGVSRFFLTQPLLLQFCCHGYRVATAAFTVKRKREADTSTLYAGQKKIIPKAPISLSFIFKRCFFYCFILFLMYIFLWYGT